MAASYEGRDLMRTQDIQGCYSTTTLKKRNIGQDMYVPEVIRHIPNLYQRQADLHKSIRNPFFNDFRYDLKQQHPQFHANSLTTEYMDSLDNFKTQQANQESEVIKTNSAIDYDFIRMQKNKNTYDNLNPPFANLHTDVSNHHLHNLASPLLTYLKKSNPFQNVDQLRTVSSRKQQYINSVGQSPSQSKQVKQQILSQSNSKRNLLSNNLNDNNNLSKDIIQSGDNNRQNTNMSEVHYEQSKQQQQYFPQKHSYQHPNELDVNVKTRNNTEEKVQNIPQNIGQQSMQNYGNSLKQQIQQSPQLLKASSPQQLPLDQSAILPSLTPKILRASRRNEDKYESQNRLLYKQQSVGSLSSSKEYGLLPQQNQLISNSFSENKAANNLPTTSKGKNSSKLLNLITKNGNNNINNNDQAMLLQQYQSHRTPNDTRNSSALRKSYKPYNIISHNRDLPYSPKFDLPEIKWDKYDRDMFKNFSMKSNAPVEIVKVKNDSMSIFSDYSTWNQKYGETK